MAGTQITVIKYEPTDPRLGRHVEHDDRSYNFAYSAKMARPKRKTTRWTSKAPVLNQGEIGSCTGNALAQWLNTDFAGSVQIANNGAMFFDEQDALDIYSKATTLDSIPGRYTPDDTGSTGNAACKAARSFGYLSGYSWLFSYSSVQAAIEQTPLIVGTLWTNDMFDPVNGLVKVGSLLDRNIAGGHEYLMVGIDYENQVFEFRNSWGDQKDWPGCKPGGYFAIGFEDWERLLDADGDVTVPKLIKLP